MQYSYLAYNINALIYFIYKFTSLSEVGICLSIGIWQIGFSLQLLDSEFVV